MYQVYVVVNKSNGKMYVGFTERELKIRWQKHLVKANEGSQCTLHKAIRKYGRDNFDIRMIDEYSTREAMLAGEIEYIAYFDTYKSEYGYNDTPGGDGGNTNGGKNFPDEWKINISKSLIGKKLSEEHVKSLSESHKGNIATNRKLSKAQVKEMRFLYKNTKISQKELGNLYGLSQSTVHNIVNNFTYQEVKYE